MVSGVRWVTNKLGITKPEPSTKMLPGGTETTTTPTGSITKSLDTGKIIGSTGGYSGGGHTAEPVRKSGGGGGGGGSAPSPTMTIDPTPSNEGFSGKVDVSSAQGVREQTLAYVKGKQTGQIDYNPKLVGGMRGGGGNQVNVYDVSPERASVTTQQPSRLEFNRGGRKETMEFTRQEIGEGRKKQVISGYTGTIEEQPSVTQQDVSNVIGSGTEDLLSSTKNFGAGINLNNPNVSPHKNIVQEFGIFSKDIISSAQQGVTEFFIPSLKTERQKSEWKEKKTNFMYEDLNKDIESYNYKYGGKELGIEEYNKATSESQLIINKQQYLANMLGTQEASDIYKRRSKDISDPIASLTSSFATGLISSPFSLASFGIGMVTNPVEEISGTGQSLMQIPAQIKIAPYSTIGGITGQATGQYLLLGGLGKGKGKVGEDRLSLSKVSERSALSYLPEINRNFINKFNSVGIPRLINENLESLKFIESRVKSSKLYQGIKTNLIQDIGAAGRLYTGLKGQYVTQPINRLKFYTEVKAYNLKTGTQNLFSDVGSYIKQSNAGRLYQSIQSTRTGLLLQEAQRRSIIGYSKQYGYLGQAERGSLWTAYQGFKIGGKERLANIKLQLGQDIGAAGRLYTGLKGQYVTQPINRLKFYSNIKLYNFGVGAKNLSYNLISPIKEAGINIGKNLYQDIGAAKRFVVTSKNLYINQPFNRLSFFADVKLYNAKTLFNKKIYSPLKQDIGAVGRLYTQSKLQYINQPINRLKLFAEIKKYNLKTGLSNIYQQSIPKRFYESYASARTLKGLNEYQGIGSRIGFSKEYGYLGKGYPSQLFKDFTKVSDKWTGTFRSRKAQPIFKFDKFTPSIKIGLENLQENLRIRKAVSQTLARSDVGYKNVLKGKQQPLFSYKITEPYSFEQPKDITGTTSQMQKGGQMQQLLIKPEQITKQISQQKVYQILPEQELQAIKTKQVLAPLQHQKQSTKQIYKNQVLQQADLEQQKQSYKLLTIPQQKTRQGSRYMQSLAQPQLYASAQIFKQPEAFAQPQPQIYSQLQAQRSKLKQPQLLKQVFKQPKGFLPKIKIGGKQSFGGGKVKLFVKQKGIWTPKGIFKDVNKAMNVGKEITGKTIHRSFKIEGGKTGLPFGYRYSRSRKQPNVFVELSKTALSQMGEQYSIKLGKMLKGGNKRR